MDRQTITIGCSTSAAEDEKISSSKDSTNKPYGKELFWQILIDNVLHVFFYEVFVIAAKSMAHKWKSF